MKLGEMLIRDGRIAPPQLDQAMAHQSRVGGRIGSIMVELGFIDAETLTVYLGLELGMPIATGATLERCKRSAVRLLSAQQAARYRCVPIVIQGQTLIIAIADPHDMEALDALHDLTGYRVLPRVAPEIRIHYYLERFYGVPRPARLRALGETPRGNSSVGSHTGGLPGPPLPGLPPRRSAPVAAPTPRPVVRRAESSGGGAGAASGAGKAPPPPAPPPVPATGPAQAGSAPPAGAAVAAGSGASPRASGGAAAAAPAPAPRRPPAPPPQQEALELDANDLVIELEADDAEVAGQAERAAAARVNGGGAGDRTASPRPDIAARREPTHYQPLTLEKALATMAATDQRGAVADAILGYAAGLFEVASLCMVRDNMALGWKGFGPDLDLDRIETLLVPLESPSIFQVTAHTRELFRGHTFPAALHDHVFKVLRSGAPLYSTVAAIAIGQRVVNLLYGHKADGSDLTDEEAEGLRQVTTAASEAYVRLISASKAQRKPAVANE